MSSTVQIEVSNLKNSLQNNYDIFICSSSFEERCLIIPSNLDLVKFKKVLICHYTPNYEKVLNNLTRLKEISTNATLLTFRKDSPTSNLDLLVDELNDFAAYTKKSVPVSILVDISTITHEMLLIFTYLFKRYLNKPKFIVNYIYNSASDYSSNETVENKWLSKGVGEVRSVLGYAGEILPNKKTLLVIFVGFEAERAKALIELFEPNKVLLGHASLEGAINEALQEKNKLIFDDLFSVLKIDIEKFTFSCKTLNETDELVEKIFQENSQDFNIIIASLNNKISTIGCALACIRHPEIQICYPTAISYNIHNYSIPSDKAYFIEL